MIRSFVKFSILALLFVAATVTTTNAENVKPPVLPDNVEAMQDMMKKMSKDPKFQKAMEQQMEEFSKLSPQEMQSKLLEAMETLSNADGMVDQMIARKKEMLTNMKRSGMVPKELIQRYEQDPDFFEQEIRATFAKGNPMSEMFGDPKEMVESMKKMMNP